MTKTVEIPIKGMTCAACAQAVGRALKKRLKESLMQR